MTIALRDEIQAAINRNSAENGSDTPDFVLANYLIQCLSAFDLAVKYRESFYGRTAGGMQKPDPSPECCDQSSPPRSLYDNAIALPNCEKVPMNPLHDHP